MSRYVDEHRTRFAALARAAGRLERADGAGAGEADRAGRLALPVVPVVGDDLGEAVLLALRAYLARPWVNR